MMRVLGTSLRIKPAGALLVLSSFFALAMPGRCLAVAAAATATPATERLELFAGDTLVLDVDALRVAVGNGRVLSVVQVDGNKLLVLGEMAGVSAVHVWTRDGGHRRLPERTGAARNLPALGRHRRRRRHPVER